MWTKEAKSSLPRRGRVGKGCPLEKWSGIWTLRCSLMNTCIGRWRGYTAPWSSEKFSSKAAHLGRKELERMIHWGHWHKLPHLDPQADVSAIQSVGPQTSRGELRDLYHQVYKLRRLPGSLTCGLEQPGELMREMVSSLKNCLRQKEDELARGRRELELADSCPTWRKTPWRGRRGTLAKNELTEAREAHRRALATTITLEEKIERLIWSITWGWPDTHTHSQSCDQWRRWSRGQSRRCHWALQDEGHSPTHSPPQWEDKQAELAFLEFDLRPSPELGPDVKHFFGESANKSREDKESNFPLEPLAEEYERWLEWRGQAVNMPSWWWELGRSQR